MSKLGAFIVPGADEACVKRLRDVTFKYASAIRESGGVSVRIVTPTLEDVYSAAAASIGFHNLDDDGWNHYKEIAHIAYWFQKLKPVRIESPRPGLAVAKALLARLGDAVLGNRAEFEEEIDKAAHEAESKYAIVRIFPVNEMIALLIVLDLMGSAQREILRNISSAAIREGYKLRYKDIRDQFSDQIEELAQALRYHNFTARGFATMIEALFKVGIRNDSAV